MVSMGKLPMCPRARNIIDYSLEESRNLNHNYVGTEHILLGLLTEKDSVAYKVLANLGLNLEEVRNRTLSLLGYGEEYKLETAISTKGFPEHWKIPRERKSLESYLSDMGFSLTITDDGKYWLISDVKKNRVGMIEKRIPPKVTIHYDIETKDLEQIGSALSLRDTLNYTNYPYSEQPSSEKVAEILSEPISKTLSLVERLKKKD